MGVYPLLSQAPTPVRLSWAVTIFVDQMCFQLEQLSPYGLDVMIPQLKDAHGLNFQRIVSGLCGLRNTYEFMFYHMQNMHSDDLSSTPINKLVSVVLLK